MSSVYICYYITMKTKAGALLKLLTIVSLSLFVLHVGLKYISVVIYNEKHGFFFELANRFDMNDETSVPQWFTHILFLAIAVLAGLAARMSKDKHERRIWTVVAVFGLILSIDDVATLHEFALQSIHNTFFLDMAPSMLRNAWLIILPFVMVLVGWLAFSMWRKLPKSTTLLFVLSGFIYLVGAVGVDTLANTIPNRDFFNQGLLAAIEGVLQMIGSSLAVYVVFEYLDSHHKDKLRTAWKALSSS